MRTCLVLLCLLAGAVPLAAQPLPDSLVWEHLGPWRSWDPTIRQNADKIAFDFEGRLLTSPQDGTLIRWLGEGLGWETLISGSGAHGGADYRFFRDGSEHGRILRYPDRRPHRSDDGGETWVEMFPDLSVRTWPVETASGAWIAGSHHNDIARSTDDGLTWQFHPLPFDEGAAGRDLARLGPESAAPGTLVAAGLSGVSASTDDGVTWQATTLTCQYCTYAFDFAVLDGGPHDGELRVTLDDNRPGPTQGQGWVWGSADGIEWRLVGQARAGYAPLQLFPLPGGRLLAWFGGDDLLRGSDDGGATWRDLGRVDASRPEWEKLHFGDVEVGPDGRLYAAVWAHNGRPPGGVYRTTEPLFAVAAEPSAPEAPVDLGVRVFPNPSAAGRVTVRWERPSSGTSSGAARVTVVDAAGRVVQTVSSAGGSTAELDTSSLAPGVYAVRVAAGGAVGAAPLTVVR